MTTQTITPTIPSLGYHLARVDLDGRQYEVRYQDGHARSVRVAAQKGRGYGLSWRTIWPMRSSSSFRRVDRAPQGRAAEVIAAVSNPPAPPSPEQIAERDARAREHERQRLAGQAERIRAWQAAQRVTAAAPELLAALKVLTLDPAILAFLQESDPQALGQALAAIAQAEGS